MSNHDDYVAKLATIQAIPTDQLKKMSIPLDAYLQEVENLYHWCQDDQAELTKVGLDWTLVDDLPIRAGACREAQSLWLKDRFTRKEAEIAWKEQSPAAYELRDNILHAMRFAYRKSPDLLTRVDNINEGSGHADMIQDLNDIAVLGKENTDPLTAVSFDLTQLDTAAATAAQIGELYAQSTTSREDVSDAKLIRDKAYVYVKQAVDEVYECGQFAFWKNPDRLKGYSSAYLRKQRKSRKSEPDA